MMRMIRRTAVATICAAVAAILIGGLATAFEDSAIVLSFNPDDDVSTRYMFQMMMVGAHVSPGLKDEIGAGDFMIGTVFKDDVVESLSGLNRHRITFYEYNVREAQAFGQDRVDPRFGGTPWPSLPGQGDDGGGQGGGGGAEGGGGGGGEGRNPGGGPGGGGGGPGMSFSPFGGNFIGGLGLPPTGYDPMQGGGGEGRNPGGGGGGGAAGTVDSAVNLDTIRVTGLDYVTNKRGEVLDVGGLDELRKVSKNRLLADDEGDKQYIDINIGHIFEWSHLLYLPDYPVYKESLWFHAYPIHVPGLPIDEPLMTNFTYKLVDFRTVGNRKVAVIDANGVAEWNMEWEERTNDDLTEYKSWGYMGIGGRYWFDYETGVVFGIERPPFVDWQYQKGYGGFPLQIPYDGMFNMAFPGLVTTMEFFYNTRTTDISGRPRMVEVGPQEKRRYIALNMFCQLEAE